MSVLNIGAYWMEDKNSSNTNNVMFLSTHMDDGVEGMIKSQHVLEI